VSSRPNSDATTATRLRDTTGGEAATSLNWGAPKGRFEAPQDQLFRFVIMLGRAGVGGWIRGLPGSGARFLLVLPAASGGSARVPAVIHFPVLNSLGLLRIAVRIDPPRIPGAYHHWGTMEEASHFNYALVDFHVGVLFLVDVHSELRAANGDHRRRRSHAERRGVP